MRKFYQSRSKILLCYVTPKLIFVTKKSKNAFSLSLNTSIFLQCTLIASYNRYLISFQYHLAKSLNLSTSRNRLMQDTLLLHRIDLAMHREELSSLELPDAQQVCGRNYWIIKQAFQGTVFAVLWKGYRFLCLTCHKTLKIFKCVSDI